MILGLGSDIVSVARIERASAKHGESFARFILSAAELNSCRKITPLYLAGRWAAKEALAKALGTGFGGKCSLNEISVLNEPQSNKPRIELAGKTLETATAAGMRKIFVTISHDGDFATATVILEC